MLDEHLKYSKWFVNTFCASLGFEPDTFGVESNRFTNSAKPRSLKVVTKRISKFY